MLGGWITFDDRKVLMDEMSHQHMSNIWYFTRYIVPHLYPDSVRNDVWAWINKRFGGVILPYHPHPDFKEEKTYLLLKGYLKDDNRIVVDNQVIGTYIE